MKYIFLIKYIKSALWRAAKCLSYIEEARCLKFKFVAVTRCTKRSYVTTSMLMTQESASTKAVKTVNMKFLQLKNDDPLLSGLHILMCLPSTARRQFGKLDLSQNSPAARSQRFSIFCNINAARRHSSIASHSSVTLSRMLVSPTGIHNAMKGSCFQLQGTWK